MSTIKKEKKIKKWLHFGIMFILMFGFQFLPPFGQVTHGGMQLIGIFAGVVYGWATIGLLQPSLLGLILAGLTDLITTNTFFSQGFGNQIFVLAIGMMILASFINETELYKVIIKTMMSFKIAKGRPWIVLLCFLYADYLVASVSNSLIAALLFIPLYVQMAEQASLPKYSPLNNAMIAGIAFAGLMGDALMPFKGFVVMTTAAFSSATGITVDLGRWFFVMLPWTVFMISFYVAICKFIFRIDATALNKVKFDLGYEKADKRQKLALLFVAFTLLLIIVPSFLPADWKATIIFKTLGNGGSVLIALFVMSLIRIDGQPLLDIGKTAKGVSWDLLFMMAFFMPIASLLTSDATGIKDTVSIMLQPIMSGLNPLAVILLLTLATLILTNFMNNLVIAIIILSMMSVLTDFLGEYNLVAVMNLIIFSSTIAYILPSGCPTSAYCYSQTELIKFNKQFLHTVICGILMFVILMTLGFAWFSLVW